MQHVFIGHINHMSKNVRVIYEQGALKLNIEAVYLSRLSPDYSQCRNQLRGSCQTVSSNTNINMRAINE